MDAQDSALRLTIFGPVRAWRDGVELDLGPPGQRALLALLLAAPDEPVGLDEIVDVLWGADPPASAVNVVHRNVGRLRRVFEPTLPARASGAWLLPSGRGYRLAVDAGSADLPAFRQHLDQARSAVGFGDSRGAVASFAAALALASAPVAGDLEPRIRAHPTFTALERERLDTLCEAADAAVDLGGPAAARTVLPALRRAAVDHQFDEPLHARLILVLGAAGRQADALACYAEVRDRLSDELGIDPGPELREAQQRVLRQQTGPAVRAGTPTDPADPAGPGAPEPAGPPPVRPAQLPPPTATFAGRHRELSAALRQAAELDASSRLLISVIGGMAGIGKTALAVHWAHQVADRFPDGQLYVDLRGFDPSGTPTTPAEAVRGFLEALGVAGSAVPADPDSRTALYRTLLAGRRVLVLLDNARDSEQARALLPGSPGCLVIVTSRNQLPGLVTAHGAEPVQLHPLPSSDAHELLTRRLGRERVAAEPAAAEAIVAACSGLPLALSIVAARAATNPTFPLAAVAGQLRESADALDALGGDDPVADARSVFSWSYGALSPDAARLFRLLALHPGPEIPAAAAASIGGLEPPAARRLLRELTTASLLGEPVPGRYAFHDLLHSYAAELLEQEDPGERAAATGRLVDHYVHTARAAFRSSGRAAVADPEPARPGVTAERPDDPAAAVGWFRRERTAVKAIVELAAGGAAGRSAALLALDCRPMDYQTSGPADLLPSVLTALRAIEGRQETALLAELHRDAGLRYTRLYDFPPAHEHFDRALAIFRELGHRAGESHTLRNLAVTHDFEGRTEEMLATAESAVTVARSADGSEPIALALDQLGWVYTELGRLEDAVRVEEEALTLMTEAGIMANRSQLLDSLAYAHLRLGDAPRAVDHYRRALDEARSRDDRLTGTQTLSGYGDALLAAGDPAGARAAWETFLLQMQDLGARHGLFVSPEEADGLVDKVRAKLAALDPPAP